MYYTVIYCSLENTSSDSKSIITSLGNIKAIPTLLSADVLVVKEQLCAKASKLTLSVA